MTHSYAWHGWFIGVIWLTHVCVMTRACVWHDSFTCMTSQIHLCNMPHSCEWHASSICVTWLVHVVDMTRPYVSHDSYKCALHMRARDSDCPERNLAIRRNGKNIRKSLKKNSTENNENFNQKIGKSRNSCTVSVVEGMGVEGMMTFKKNGALVWDWRTG